MVSAVEQIKSQHDNTLLLDSGLWLPMDNTNEVELADLIFNIMHKTGYQAVNLGLHELLMGYDYLKDVSARIDFPLISANVLYQGENIPFVQKYIIKEIGGLKFGITGILNSGKQEQLTAPLSVGDFTVLPPESAANDVLTDVKGKADFVILLSQYSYEDTENMMEKLDAVDLAIITQSRQIRAESSPQVVQSTVRGDSLESLVLNIGEDKQVSIAGRNSQALNTPVALEKLYAERVKAITEEKAEKERRKWEEEIKALHQLSPMEYYEMMLKENSSRESETQTENKQEERKEWQSPLQSKCGC